MRGGSLSEGEEGSVRAPELHEGWSVSVRNGSLQSGGSGLGDG